MHRAIYFLALACALVASGCGGSGGTSGDTATDDAAPADSVDGVDTAVDPGVDTTSDTGTDVVEDTTVDTAEDPAPDGELTECEEAGGYCTEYPVIPDTCVTCDSTSVTHYRPAHNPLGAMECTVEGVGGSPWCCLPHESTPSDCVTDGGECYPYADPEPCPPGWAAIYSSCGVGEGVICCAPASEHCG